MPYGFEVEPVHMAHHIRRMSGKPDEQEEQSPAMPVEKPAAPALRPREIGGPKGPEPTRYGDWEYNGRCTDF